MTARYLKAENSGLFSSVKLLFEKANIEQTCVVMENQALYEVTPAKKKLGQANKSLHRIADKSGSR
jgi:hypothetical protein